MPKNARLAINMPADFADRADALVPIPFGFGDAALAAEEIDEPSEREAAGLLFELAGCAATLRVTRVGAVGISADDKKLRTGSQSTQKS